MFFKWSIVLILSIQLCNCGKNKTFIKNADGFVTRITDYLKELNGYVSDVASKHSTSLNDYSTELKNAYIIFNKTRKAIIDRVAKKKSPQNCIKKMIPSIESKINEMTMKNEECIQDLQEKTDKVLEITNQSLRSGKTGLCMENSLDCPQIDSDVIDTVEILAILNLQESIASRRKKDGHDVYNCGNIASIKKIYESISELDKKCMHEK